LLRQPVAGGDVASSMAALSFNDGLLASQIKLSLQSYY
jgi:hypothetical protein